MSLLPALLLQATKWLDELELVTEQKCGSSRFPFFFNLWTVCSCRLVFLQTHIGLDLWTISVQCLVVTRTPLMKPQQTQIGLDLWNISVRCLVVTRTPVMKPSRPLYLQYSVYCVFLLVVSDSLTNTVVAGTVVMCSGSAFCTEE